MKNSTFRLIGSLEAVSFLALLGVAMPLKYHWGMPEATKFAGSIHGALFLGYAVAAHLLADKNNWPSKQLLLAYGAAIVPFGPFFFDRKFLRQ